MGAQGFLGTIYMYVSLTDMSVDCDKETLRSHEPFSVSLAQSTLMYVSYTDVYLSFLAFSPLFLFSASLSHALLKNTCLNFTSGWMHRCESANIFR